MPDQRLAIRGRGSAAKATEYHGGVFQGHDDSIRVRWSVTDGILTLDWQEKSGRKIEPPTRQGFGSRLIQQTIVRELHGSINATYQEDGLHAVFTVPLSVDDRLVV